MKGINSLMRKNFFFLLKMRGTKLKYGILDIQSDRNVSFRWNEHGRQKKYGGSDVNVFLIYFFLVIFLRFLFVSFRENVSLRAVSVYISKSEDGQRKKMAEEMVDLQG